MTVKKRHSGKRDALLKAIRSSKSHPSADMVYLELRQEFPDLSLGTVYRNIASFMDEGVIRSVGVVRGEERFDGNITNHPHFICSSCGRVIDIDTLEDTISDDDIASRLEVKVDRHDLTFYGKCAQCMK